MASSIGIQDSNQKIVLSNLQLHLDGSQLRSLTKTSPTRWNDISPSGARCGITGSIVYNSDAGGCLQFDGTANSGTQSESNIGNINNAASICLWLKHISGGTQPNTQRYFSTGYERMVIRRQGSDFMFYINVFSGTGIDLKFLYVNLGSVLTSGEIFNLVSVWNGSAMILYKNAVQIGSLAVTGTVSENSLYYVLSAPTWTENFNGRMYDVMFYNKALSTAEISQNYEVTRKRFGV